MNDAVRGTYPKLKVHTLLEHVPENSFGLKTSLVGKIIFLLATTTFTVILLKVRPYFYFPHLFMLATYSLAMLVFGANNLIRSRRVTMLLAACFLIGIVNFLLSPEWVLDDWVVRAKYGLTRGSAYAALSFASLLVATLTRPSDPVRLVARFTSNPNILFLVAIPFAIFGLLASVYGDILMASRVRFRTYKQPKKLYYMVLSVAAGLLSVALNRTLYLSQSSGTFDTPSSETPRRKLLGQLPIVSAWDLLFIIVLLPGLAITFVW